MRTEKQTTLTLSCFRIFTSITPVARFQHSATASFDSHFPTPNTS